MSEEPKASELEKDNKAGLLPAAKARARARDFYYKHLRRQLTRWAPLRRLINDLEMRSRAANWGEKDDEKNIETRPPAEEQVMLHGLWAVEFYTPSQIEGLFDGFKSLGWDQSAALSGSSPISWIRNQRDSMRGGGWFNLGVISTEPRGSVLSRDRRAPLPASVEYATGSVQTITSALTCVVIFFAYKEARLSSFQRALMSSRKTSLTPSDRGGYVVADPEHQKRAEIEAIRKTCRTEAWEWFRSNLPGVFTSERRLPREFPTCELLTTKIAEPFLSRAERKESLPRYLGLLEIDHGFDAWAAHSMPSLRLGTYWRKTKSHLVATIKLEHLMAEGEQHHFGKSQSGAVSYMNNVMEQFISRWGIVALFSLLQRRVNLLRDGVRRYATHRRPAIQSLSALTDVELRSLDVITVANDAKHFADQPSWFMHNVTDFKPVEPQAYKGESFVSNLRNHLAEQAKWLATADEQVRRAVTQQTNLLATRENMRLQQQMRILTVVAIVFALISIVTATNSGKAHLEPIVSRFLSWDPFN